MQLRRPQNVSTESAAQLSSMAASVRGQRRTKPRGSVVCTWNHEGGKPYHDKSVVVLPRCARFGLASFFQAASQTVFTLRPWPPDNSPKHSRSLEGTVDWEYQKKFAHSAVKKL